MESEQPGIKATTTVIHSLPQMGSQLLPILGTTAFQPQLKVQHVAFLTAVYHCQINSNTLVKFP